MKSVVLAVALTGLMAVTALAGNIPTSDAPAPGNIPTSDTASPAPAPLSVTGMGSSTILTDLVLTIVTLTSR